MTIVSATANATLTGFIPKTYVGAKAAQNDTILFSNEAGVIPISVIITGINTAPTVDTFTYATIQYNGTTTAASTSVAYNNATANDRTSGGWFAIDPGTNEAMYVVADSGYNGTTGTLTVMRGALGTTAAAGTDDNEIIVMNSIKLTGTATGQVRVLYYAFPKDPYAELF